jgi:hypothetical protein
MACGAAAAVPGECAGRPTLATGPVGREAFMVLGCN